MHTSILFLSCAFGVCLGSEPAPAFQAPGAASSSRAATAKMKLGQSGPEPLKKLANDLNPAVGYYDPLRLAEQEFWEQSNDATIGFLRHAEIKHGRVAMAAFVGYCLQSNGIVFPWKLTDSVSHSDILAAGSPPEQWDALPTASKVQILLFIGFLEYWGENSYILEKDGLKHYMRGGVPGKFPSFASLPHPVPFNLYDPFKLNNKKTREQLDKKLLAEVNNGRLAQLGIMAFLAEQKVPGSVPVLSGLFKAAGAEVKPYAGEIMAPFTSGDASLPYVTGMLTVKPLER